MSQAADVIIIIIIIGSFLVEWREGFGCQLALIHQHNVPLLLPPAAPLLQLLLLLVAS